MTEELKPCPFCGGSAWSFPSDYGDIVLYNVRCRFCYAAFDGFSKLSAAIEKWNRRVGESHEQTIEVVNEMVCGAEDGGMVGRGRRFTNRIGKPCVDCGDGPCDMNCGPAVPPKSGHKSGTMHG